MVFFVTQGRHIHSETFLKICDGISLWGLILLFFAMPFEREQRVFYYTSQIMAISGWLARILVESGARQWRRTIIHFGLMIAVSIPLTLLFGHKPTSDVLRSFFWELGVLSFYVLFIINRENPFRPAVSGWKVKKLFDFFLGAYGVWILFSCFLSWFPEDSFSQLRKGFIAFLLIYLCISNIRSFGRFRKIVFAGFLSILITSIIILVQGLAYRYGDFDIKMWLVRKEAVRPFSPGTDNPLFHSQFPFDHFHKAGMFLAMGLHLVLLQYFITVKRVTRRWVAVAGGIVLAALLFTLTRGALVAALAALIFLIVLTRKKYLTAVVALLAILALFIPVEMKRFYGDSFHPASLRNPTSLLGFRVSRWALTAEIILRNPVFGTGYGVKQYQDVARVYSPQIRMESRPHPHSWYLQTAHESGIPGLLFFLAFTTLLVAILYLRWRRESPVSYYRGINAAFLSLLTVPYLFGLVGFVHYGAPGMFVWITFGLCASYLKLTVKPRDIEEMRRELASREEPVDLP